MKQPVVIYTRVSTDKQTTDSQLASLREYCARHDWQDVQVITDTVSGSKISRKGLDQLMKAVRAGKVDVVLCYNLDRLGRSFESSCAFARRVLRAQGRSDRARARHQYVVEQSRECVASQHAWSDRAV